MSTSIIIGREGGQPFVIDAKRTRVSRQHAKLYIDGDKLTLKNLSKENYTFVREEQTGLLRAIEQKRVSEDTFVVLGEDSAHGCQFYVRQVLSSSASCGPATFADDFIRIRQKFDEYKHMRDALNRNIKILQIGVPVVITAIMMLLLGPKIGALGVLSGLFARLIPEIFAKKKKSIEQIRELYCRCPNPECSRPNPLSEDEIHNMQCSRCGAM